MFSTLQRPTSEEAERRRVLREALTSPPRRSSTLQRRESILSRGFNAIFRRDSMMKRPQQQHMSGHATGYELNLRTGPPVVGQHNGPAGKRLSRAMSFKHPERVSHIPPPEVTRYRSKSQHSINDYEESSGGSSGGGGGGSGGYDPLPPRRVGPVFHPGNVLTRDDYFMRGGGGSSPPPPHRGGYNGGWVPRERFAVQRQQSFMPPPLGLGRGGRGGFRRPVAPTLLRRQRRPLPDAFRSQQRWDDER